MNIRKVWGIFFSPTGTTERVVESIAREVADSFSIPWEMIDLTLPESRKITRQFQPNELVILGTPIYAGRVPNVIVNELKSNLSGNGALGVAVVVFGNRNFDDGLIELRDILSQNNFQVVAGGAFVGEHSFSRVLAAGRPDEADIKTAVDFASRIATKCKEILPEDMIIPVSVEGQKLYRNHYVPKSKAGEPVDLRKVKPRTKENCIDCKICAQACPMGSINPDNVSEVPGICIKCGACVKKCPVDAKYFDDPGFLYHKKELEEDFERRAEPKLFL